MHPVFAIRPFARGACQRGFTLIEITLVMIILGLVAALIVPNITNVGGGDIKLESRTLIGHIQAAYNEATFTRTRHRMVFDLDEQRYWTEVEAGTAYAPVESNFLKRVDLPVNIRFADVMTGPSGKRSEGRAYAHFYPLGRVDFTTIHLETEDGDAMTLLVNPLTGRVKVADGYVVEGYG